MKPYAMVLPSTAFFGSSLGNFFVRSFNNGELGFIAVLILSFVVTYSLGYFIKGRFSSSDEEYDENEDLLSEKSDEVEGEKTDEDNNENDQVDEECSERDSGEVQNVAYEDDDEDDSEVSNEDEEKNNDDHSHAKTSSCLRNAKEEITRNSQAEKVNKASRNRSSEIKQTCFLVKTLETLHRLFTVDLEELRCNDQKEQDRADDKIERKNLVEDDSDVTDSKKLVKTKKVNLSEQGRRNKSENKVKNADKKENDASGNSSALANCLENLIETNSEKSHEQSQTLNERKVEDKSEIRTEDTGKNIEVLNGLGKEIKFDEEESSTKSENDLAKQQEQDDEKSPVFKKIRIKIDDKFIRDDDENDEVKEDRDEKTSSGEDDDGSGKSQCNFEIKNSETKSTEEVSDASSSEIPYKANEKEDISVNENLTTADKKVAESSNFFDKKCDKWNRKKKYKKGKKSKADHQGGLSEGGDNACRKRK